MITEDTKIKQIKHLVVVTTNTNYDPIKFTAY